MALKGDRYEANTDISFFMNVVSERGGPVVLAGVGSGAALDQGVAQVTVTSATVPPSGAVPIGLLLNDVVDIDQTRQKINMHKDEMQRGGKVCILRHGWVVTNMIEGAPSAGATAYVGNSGLISGTPANDFVASIGRFDSTVDEDGYARVFVNLP